MSGEWSLLRGDTAEPQSACKSKSSKPLSHSAHFPSLACGLRNIAILPVRTKCEDIKIGKENICKAEDFSKVLSRWCRLDSQKWDRHEKLDGNVEFT